MFSTIDDGETWQEYLAAHLGEPIRNFGVGGFGVYQAYRRLLRTEQTEDGAEYLILYVWGDDHFRSVMRCRHAVIYPFWDHEEDFVFTTTFVQYRDGSRLRLSCGEGERVVLVGIPIQNDRSFVYGGIITG